VPIAVGSGGAQYAELLTEGFAPLVNSYNRWIAGDTVQLVRSVPMSQRTLIRSYDKLPKPSKDRTRGGVEGEVVGVGY
jgi:hypothetical protein